MGQIGISLFLGFIDGGWHNHIQHQIQIACFGFVGDAFALRSDYAMQIDFEEKAPQFQVSDTHWAKTWLLHEDAPKVEKPVVIQNLHEKIRANMGFAHLGDEEEGNA